MKRLLIISFSIIMTVSLIGCGKKSNSVADNLVNDDPSKVQGIDMYADMGSTLNSESEEPYTGEIVDTISVNSVSDNTISDNVAVSENAVSDNMLSADNMPLDSVSENEVEDDSFNDLAMAEVYTPVENNTLNIANLSGKNIEAIYVTFSEGNLKGSEILGTKKLKDGGTYTYTIDDMESLRNAGIIKLGITAIDSKENDINFGEIDIVDPNNMTIVLSSKGSEYYMCQY